MTLALIVSFALGLAVYPRLVREDAKAAAAAELVAETERFLDGAR